ncbi:MAG TPA: hypothetical protein VHL79_05845 [Ramlibacter sp.]|jgi:hypothetical protein|nr:hypothetical protein [Ramlibacter sp.]
MTDSRDEPSPEKQERSEFLQSLRTGLLVGVALLVLIVPPLRMMKNERAQEEAARSAGVASQPSTSPQAEVQVPGGAARLADFRGEQPTADARLVADWAVFTGNHKKHAFVVIDKKDARVYIFGPDGKLRDSAPALLGSARGDDSFPGIGDKPLSQIRPEEKTTPAGRFVAEPGVNTNNEDIIWVDYDAAVSMHRVRPTVEAERRLERLATLTTDDNRISFGCVNLPVSFYESVLSPIVQKHGAIVYVLPETKSVQAVFGAFDVRDPLQVAEWQKKLASARPQPQAAGMQKVALQPQ